MSTDYTLSFTKANSYALALVIPILALYLVPYSFIYGVRSLGSDLLIFFRNIPLLLASFVIGTALHELIHAICWSWLDGIPWRNIHFGFKWATLTPYVHCPEPVEVSNYRWGVAMPGIVLGFLPYLLAFILHNGWLLGFGLIFTLAASGDILILWLLRKVESGTLVQDHPALVGCRTVDTNTKKT
ncbi:MAG TPA: DUF3267 domain-containing protein [Balneolaceae bacterium]|nr:DUF3267 domain-containing protein [Balneolaceae bacterium]